MNKGVMLSIHPEWLEMIFNEEKGLEFRKKSFQLLNQKQKYIFMKLKRKMELVKLWAMQLLQK